MSIFKPSFPRLRRSHDLAQGLVGAWLLYEGSGTVVSDLADQGSNGTAGEGLYGTLHGSLSWSQGQSGYMLSGFTGGATTATYIDCGNSSALNPTGGISLAAWIKTGAFNSSGNWVLSRDDNSLGRSYAFGPGNTGSSPSNLQLQINGANTILTGETPLTVNKWWFILATGNAQSGYAVYYGSYEAGVGFKKSGTTASWTAPATTTGNTNIGRRTFSGNQDGLGGGSPDGFIESAFIWNRGLNALEGEQAFEDTYEMMRHRSWRLKSAAAATAKVPWPLFVFPQQAF